MARSITVVILCVALPLLGCVTNLGPRTITRANFSYNEAVSRSWNEQFVLNLVRLRYGDTALFLEVGSILAQYELQGSTNADATILEGAGNILGLGLGGSYSERPTITYVPLRGERYVQSVLRPIAPSVLFLLSQSGWSLERLFLCCVSEMNGIRNAPAATGPTPTRPPVYEDFNRISYLLRQIQIAGRFAVRYELIEGASGDEASDYQPYISFLPGADEAIVAEIRSLLGLPEGISEFRVVSNYTADRSPEDIVLAGRSVLGVLYYLSQAVEVPEEDEQAGRVTVTRTPSGERFDWREAIGGLLQIQTADEEPTNAYVRVHYRDHWFFIEDSDLESKSTFSLLLLIFSVQSAGSEGGLAPLITVPAG